MKTITLLAALLLLGCANMDTVKSYPNIHGPQYGRTTLDPTSQAIGDEMRNADSAAIARYNAHMSPAEQAAQLQLDCEMAKFDIGSAEGDLARLGSGPLR